MMTSMMHPIYMPFAETQLGSHFAKSREKQVDFYRKKIEIYQKYLHENLRHTPFVFLAI